MSKMAISYIILAVCIMSQTTQAATLGDLSNSLSSPDKLADDVHQKLESGHEVENDALQVNKEIPSSEALGSNKLVDDVFHQGLSVGKNVVNDALQIFNKGIPDLPSLIPKIPSPETVGNNIHDGLEHGKKILQLVSNTLQNFTNTRSSHLSSESEELQKNINMLLHDARGATSCVKLIDLATVTIDRLMKAHDTCSVQLYTSLNVNNKKLVDTLMKLLNVLEQDISSLMKCKDKELFTCLLNTEVHNFNGLDPLLIKTFQELYKLFAASPLFSCHMTSFSHILAQTDSLFDNAEQCVSSFLPSFVARSLYY